MFRGILGDFICRDCITAAGDQSVMVYEIIHVASLRIRRFWTYLATFSLMLLLRVLLLWALRQTLLVCWGYLFR